MKHHIKRLKRELVYQGSILDIYADYMQLPDGKTAKWDFVSHRKGAAGSGSGCGEWKSVTGSSVPFSAGSWRRWRSRPDQRDSVTEDTMVCATRGTGRRNRMEK